ncbi:MinD/ParA family ATP-binding protein [Natrinema sp. CGMCC1.2065]|uniref:MinD/ParA family ATP-binding protein n=1 Tax=Natrinema sp. CGMCC1.2065 TaxID=3445767 RepID=UPI003F49E4D8
MIVAVGGGKGGVGKSTLALNLAHELDGVVVDGDLAAADLPRGGGPDLHDVLADRTDPLEAVDRRGPVRLLPCGRTLAGARAADLSAFPRIVRRLEREFGRVVIDCPAGLARDVGRQLASAHAAVLVTTPTEPALTDAMRTRQVALDLETPVAAVALNRTSGAVPDGIAERIERTVSAPVRTLEERSAVADAQRRGRPVAAVAPDCPAVEPLRALARRLERCTTHDPDRSDAHDRSPAVLD